MNGKVLPGAVAGLNVKFANDNNQKNRNSNNNPKSNRGSGSPYGASRGYSYSHMPYEAYTSSG
ncbi:unnamed protein product, partial [Medioppia subpectinata]